MSQIQVLLVDDQESNFDGFDKEEFDGGMSQTLGEQEDTNQEFSFEELTSRSHIPFSLKNILSLACSRILKSLPL